MRLDIYWIKGKYGTLLIINCLSVCFEALRPSQQFYSHVGSASWVKPVLSNVDEVSCSRAQHRAIREIRMHELAIKS